MNNANEKPRFRFNIIDVLVVLLLIGLIVLLVTRKAPAQTAPAQEPAPAAEAVATSGPPADFAPNLRFTAVAYGLDNALAEKIAADPQNRIYNGYQLYNAYIVSSEVVPSTLTQIGDDGDPVSCEDPLHSDVIFVVEACLGSGDPYVNISGNFNACLGSQEVRLGKLYTLKTLSIELATTVIAMEAPIDG